MAQLRNHNLELLRNRSLVLELLYSKELVLELVLVLRSMVLELVHSNLTSMNEAWKATP
ncbi:MAG: hypothetical protein ACK56W_03385 [Pirellula sp.]|nr:hypothetical protein [Pirellula sp.]